MTAPPAVETAAGMEVYVSSSQPCSGRLRTTDDDFQVKEVLAGVESQMERFPGSFPLYEVTKRSIDTFHLERELSAILRSRISYAGIKDKRAVAVQYVTPLTAGQDYPDTIESAKFACRKIGYLQRPLSRSMVAGNGFRIVVRGCSSQIEGALSETKELCSQRKLPNFYGLQRFGTTEAMTHRVGRALVKAQFQDAIRILLEEPRRLDDDETANARTLFKEGLYNEGAERLPAGQDMERLVALALAKEPKEAVKAMRAVPITIRRFYVQAYQSYIFNRTLSLALREGQDISRYQNGDNWAELSVDGLGMGKVHGVKETPVEGATPLIQLVGYAHRDYGSRFDSCLNEVLEQEGVSPKEFYVKEMQEVSAEGGFRRANLGVKDFRYELEGETAVLDFALARGGYATVLLREVIKPEDPTAAGFG